MLGRLGLDLGDQVAAELAARRLREHLRPAQRELARGDQVAFLLEHPRLALDGQRGDVVVRVGADERLQRRLVAGVLVLAEGGVPAPGQPLQVGIGKRQPRRRIVLVEAEQVLVEADGFERGRLGIGASRASRP